jgi:hypothetical protein
MKLQWVIRIITSLLMIIGDFWIALIIVYGNQFASYSLGTPSEQLPSAIAMVILPLSFLMYSEWDWNRKHKDDKK